jgi:hypothetical protein
VQKAQLIAAAVAAVQLVMALLQVKLLMKMALSLSSRFERSERRANVLFVIALSAEHGTDVNVIADVTSLANIASHIAAAEPSSQMENF